jgi:hypothetical protein
MGVMGRNLERFDGGVLGVLKRSQKETYLSLIGGGFGFHGLLLLHSAWMAWLAFRGRVWCLQHSFIVFGLFLLVDTSEIPYKLHLGFFLVRFSFIFLYI